MALKALGSETVRIIGWTEPRPYEAGANFPAGRSFRVCVGLDEHGFEVLKVKGEDCDKVWAQMNAGSIKVGAVAEIKFEQGTSYNGQQAIGILREVKLLVGAGAGAPAAPSAGAVR